MGIGFPLVAAIALAVEPARLTAGDAAVAVLQISAPPGAALTLWTSTGTISAPVAAGPGRFTAKYQATPDRFPRVALVLATARMGGSEERAWLSLPIAGRDKLALSTKPSSGVEVQIGNAVFGPVRSDREGHASVPVTVPPGIRTATVRVRDSFGNEKLTAFDLRPPPFRRLRMIASGESASWADDAPLALEIFAVDASGRPARRADLRVSADRGELGAAEERAPGVFTLAFRAPQRIDLPRAKVQARLSADEASAESVQVALRPGPPARIELTSSARSVQPGGSLRLSAALMDAHGNALSPDRVRMEADLGQLVAGEPGSAELRVPASFAGREVIQVVARAGEVLARLPIALAAGAPAAVQVRFEVPQVREGEEVNATVQVADAGGNPVRGAELRFEPLGAALQHLQELSPGRYALRVRALPASAPAAELRVQAGAIKAMALLQVVPEERPWGISAGGWLLGQHNFSRAASGGLEAEVAAHAGTPRLEGFCRALALQFAPTRTQIDPGAAQRSSLEAFGAQVGARMLFPLHAGWSVHLSGAAGLLRALGTLRIEGGPADGVSEPAAKWAPLLSAAVGSSLRLGPGRLLAEAQLSAAPSSGAVQGNLGGLSLRAGWLFNLR